ncbi:glycosyltransferase [Pseudomonas stutzeri]|uniref:glycosyltransferase family protein n=1 Tax=Stutzerimonas stutzeri TaxID=316 RepID=UPI00210B9FD7|nr:glycosyltransferase [Stutzerimonas stutzeri]MCQ4287303.1 glycosyltransferase [Stutzerimonas stutzeri]
MKILMLVMDEQRIILERLYESVRINSDECKIVRLSKSEQKRLGNVLRKHNSPAYDRVVIFSRLKRLRCQVDVLRCVPGLVFIEHDACQNYMPTSKYHGLYSRFYQRLPWARVVSSGAGVARRLRSEGVDARFVSKGYDEKLIMDLGRKRDIDAAFLGSVNGHSYQERRRMLESIATQTDLLVTRTDSGLQYVESLNRIRIFVSADVGMGEYMVKNFEAMACGCALLAWSQGSKEDSAMGFEDGKNVMLYRSADEAVAKLRQLKADPDLVARIALAGQAFAVERYSFARVGRDLARTIAEPMRPWPGLSCWRRAWVRLRYGLKT